jgi:hypothetical protein
VRHVSSPDNFGHYEGELWCFGDELMSEVLRLPPQVAAELRCNCRQSKTRCFHAPANQSRLSADIKWGNSQPRHARTDRCWISDSDAPGRPQSLHAIRSCLVSHRRVRRQAGYTSNPSRTYRLAQARHFERTQSGSMRTQWGSIRQKLNRDWSPLNPMRFSHGVLALGIEPIWVCFLDLCHRQTPIPSLHRFSLAGECA